MYQLYVLVEPDVNRIDNSLGKQLSPTICRCHCDNQLKLCCSFFDKIFATVLRLHVEIFNLNR